MEVKLTIYCLTYNHEKYIEQTLHSFLNQKTNFKYKIIVHDDASTDNTQSIIKRIAEQNPGKIETILQKENVYSKGIRPVEFVKPLTEGEYIAVCEGDDYWISKYKLQKQVDFLEAHKEYSACVHNSVFLNMRYGTKRKFNTINKKDCDLSIENLISWVNGKYHTSSLVYRRKYLMNQPDFITKIHEFGDYPLALYLAIEGKIHYFSDVWSVYRYLSGVSSWSAKHMDFFSNIEGQIIAKKAEIRMLKMLKDYAPQYTAIIDKEILNKKLNMYTFQGKLMVILKNDNLRKFFLKQTICRKTRILLWCIFMKFHTKR